MVGARSNGEASFYERGITLRLVVSDMVGSMRGFPPKWWTPLLVLRNQWTPKGSRTSQGDRA